MLSIFCVTRKWQCASQTEKQTLGSSENLWLRKARFHKPVCTADSVYTSQLFNHGESCTRGSRQFARNNGSDAGSTSVNRMSSREFAIAAMKMPTIRYGGTNDDENSSLQIRLRILDKERTIDDKRKFLDILVFIFCVFVILSYHRNRTDFNFNLFLH